MIDFYWFVVAPEYFATSPGQICPTENNRFREVWENETERHTGVSSNERGLGSDHVFLAAGEISLKRSESHSGA